MNKIILFKGVSINSVSSLPGLFLVLCLIAACTPTTSEEYLEQARRNIDKREFQTAIINLKNALQQDSKNGQARYLLGKTYINVRDGASAEKELEAAQRLNFSPELLAVPLGKAYLLQGKSKKLLDELNPELNFSNQIRAEVFVLQAQAHLMLGEEDKANKMLSSALREAPESLSAILLKARLAIIQSDLALSQSLVEQVINKQPTNIEAWLTMGRIARLKGDFVTAKKAYDKTLELESTSIPALLGIAEISIEDGDFKAALQSAEKIQSRSPNHPLASYVQAVVLYQQKKLEEAEEALHKALKVVPDHLPSLRMLGAINFSNGKYEQARVSLEKVVSGLPNNLAVRKLLASTWLKLGQPESAVKILEEVLSANVKDAQLLALLGSAHIQGKNFSKGGEYLGRAVALSPENAAIQTQLALGRLMAGKTAKAVEALETAVELGQDIFQADILLVLTRMRSKEFNKALDMTKKLALKLPNSAVPHNLAGAAFLGLGNKLAARESFEKALKVQADFTPAAMNLAKLDEKEGDIKSARARLERVAKNSDDNVKAVLALARIAGQEGNRDESEKWLNQAWEQNVGDLQVGTLLVRYWMERREFTKAVDIAKGMKTQHPEDFAALKAYGLAQIATDQKNGALETFRSLAYQHSGVAEAHYLLGKAYITVDDFSSAQWHINKALGLDNQFLPAQLALSQIAVKNGDLDKAMRIAKKLQQQRSSLSVGYELEGNIHMQAKSFTAAAKAYANGFAKAPSGLLAVKHFQAERQYQNKKADTALLVQWLEQHPNDVRVRSVLAQAYIDSDNKQNAVTQYKKALEKSPKNVSVLNNLAWLYHEMGHKEALSYGKKAYDLAPQNPAVMDTYGWLLVQDGKSKQGLEYIQKAFQQASNVAEIQFHYAVALKRSGKMQRAREELEKLLAKHEHFPQSAEARAMLSKMR